jgi:hypothetical protein
LRKLGPVLDESSPARIVFDPVDNLLAGGTQTDVTASANELAVWFRSSGATVVLVANGENQAVIESLTPLVRESFRFGVRESSDRFVRFIAFEKSSWVPDQAVRVDPFRGIFLVEDPQIDEHSDETVTTAAEIPTGPEACQCSAEQQEPIDEIQILDPANEGQVGSAQAKPQVPDPSADIRATPLVREKDDPAAAVAPEEARDAFFAMLDELQSFVSSIDPDGTETEGVQNSLNPRLPEPGDSRFTTPSID